VHFPETVLQAGGLGGERGFPGVLVHGQGEFIKNHTELKAEIFFKLLERSRDCTAGRTLEVAEFFERDGRRRLAAHVERRGFVRRWRRRIASGGGNSRPPGPVKQSSTAERK